MNDAQLILHLERRICELRSELEPKFHSLTKIEERLEKMSKEIDDLTSATNAFISEVTSDVANLLASNKALADQITALQAQPSVSADDLAKLSDLAARLNAATSDVHAKTSAFSSPVTDPNASATV